MGLTRSAVGRGAERDARTRREPGDLLAALAGNPNVGKSTVFNALTGMNQHTGNWPGKTVATAEGVCRVGSRRCLLEDIPGTYSLLARSAEEEVARDFVCFGGADAVAVVCDATCLERNLNLVLQILEVTPHVVVCVNLLDEAKRRGVAVNLGLLERRLGVPVCGVTARKPATLTRLTGALDDCVSGRFPLCPLQIAYPAAVEQAAALVARALEPLTAGKLSPRWAALRLLEGDEPLRRRMTAFLGADPLEDPAVQTALDAAKRLPGMLADGALRDALASAPVRTAEAVASGAVSRDGGASAGRDRKLDGILTGPWAYPVMLAALAGIFYLTVAGANVPSAYLADFLFRGEGALRGLLAQFGAPEWLRGLLADGAYRVLAWVVSVMLPPMAIFFPLFTLLEDAGFLPRAAFNLDCPFRKCGACGKQALTMAMGFGCNAAGVVGCRIIDSPRERLLAMLTNSFVPCNGRFPALIALLGAFFAGSAGGWVTALGVTAAVTLGVAMTFAATWLLNRTALRGAPSSFTLELPPYRRPQIGKVIVRSVFDRTLFVLGRAAAVAAPAGAVIWTLANCAPGGVSLLTRCAGFLDPLGRFLGLDGVILLAFVLGFPANEIVVPLILMGYTAQGTLAETGGTAALRAVLVAHGWTKTTAVCAVLFFLMHWPCSTTLLTIRKESGSGKWTALAFALPTVLGMAACAAAAGIARVW